MCEQQGGKFFLQNLNRFLIQSPMNIPMEEIMDVDILKSIQKLENYETIIIFYMLLR